LAFSLAGSVCLLQKRTENNLKILQARYKLSLNEYLNLQIKRKQSFQENLHEMTPLWVFDLEPQIPSWLLHSHDPSKASLMTPHQIASPLTTDP